MQRSKRQFGQRKHLFSTKNATNRKCQMQLNSNSISSRINQNKTIAVQELNENTLKKLVLQKLNLLKHGVQPKI